jgi:hypothetical protein
MTQATKLDVCDKCHKRTSQYRVKVQIFLLEDFPLRQYYFELCEACSKLLARSNKRQKLQVHELPVYRWRNRHERRDDDDEKCRGE